MDFPLAHLVTLCLHSFTFLHQFTAIDTVGIAGVTVFGAGGFLCTAQLCIGVPAHGSSFCQECRPYIFTGIGKGHCLAGLGLFVQNQLIEDIGLAVVAGEVQIAILAHNHGAQRQHGFFQSGEGITHFLQVGGVADRLCGVIEVAVGISIELPDMAVVIQEEQFFSLIGLAGILNSINTAGGNGHKFEGVALIENVIEQIPSRIIVGVGGILCGDPEGTADHMHTVCLSIGEQVAVGHIVNLAFPSTQFGGGAGDRIHTQHSFCRGIHAQQIAVCGFGCAQQHGIQRHAGSPGVILQHIPSEHHGIAVYIQQNTFQIDRQGVHSNGDGIAEVGIQLGGDGNGGGTRIQSGDQTVLIHIGDGGIFHRPDHAVIGNVPRQDGDAQSLGIASEQVHFILGQFQNQNFIGGVCPVAALAFLGNHQRHQLMAHVIVESIGIGFRMDFVEVAVIPVAPELFFVIVAGPDHIAGIGVIFHSLSAHGGKGGIVFIHHFHHEGRLCHGLQGEGINLAGAKLIAIEGAVGITGQGIDIHAHSAHFRDSTHHFVNGVEHGGILVIVSHAVDLAIIGVVGHILEHNTQVADKDHIGQIPLGHDIQIAIVCAGEDIVVVNGSSIEHNAFGLAVDRQIAVPGVEGKGSPVIIVLLIESDQVGQRRNDAQLHTQLIGGDIVGVVINLDQELIAVGSAQIQLIAVCFAGNGFFLGAHISQHFLAGAVEQCHSSYILIVGGLHSQHIVLYIHSNIQDGRCGAVHGQGDGQSGAGAQSVPVDGAVFIDIVLRCGIHTEFHGVTLGYSPGCPLQAVGIQTLEPHLHEPNHTVVGSINVAGFIALENFAGGHVGGSHTAGVGITQSIDLQIVDLVAVLVIECIALRMVGAVSNHRVAAQVVGVTGITGVLYRQRVHSGSAGVGITGLLAGGMRLDSTHLIHGRIAPVAIEGQNRDGVAGAVHAFFVSDGIGISKGLHISTVDIVSIQIGLLFLGEGQGHRNFHIAIGRNLHGIILQLTVGRPHCGEIHSGSGGIQINGQIVGIALLGGGRVGVIDKGILGEHISGENEALFRIFQVVDGEGEGIHTGTLGIITQLGLDLAVGLTIHQDVGVGHDSCQDVDHACALLDHGVVTALGIRQRQRGGHKDALHQRAVSQAVLRQASFLDRLLHQRDKAGDLGRCHGSTGHQFVLIGFRYSAVDGVDIAAGCGNFRLQGQITGDAPGGECAHGVIGGVFHIGGSRTLHGQLASVVLHTVFRGGRLRILSDHLALLHGDDDAGSLFVVAGEHHIDACNLIVINDGSDGAMVDSNLCLVGKIDFATGHKDDLTGDIDAFVIRIHTDTVDEDILIFRALAIGVHGGHRLIPATIAIAVADVDASNLDGRTYIAVVFHGSDGKGIGKGAGRTGSLEVDILNVQIGQNTGGVGSPVTLVAGGHSHHGFRLNQIVHQFLVFAGRHGEAGTVGTQRQVDGIAVQNNSVLNCGEIVGRIAAAHLAEDLHYDDLGIGGISLHGNRLGSGNKLASPLDEAVGSGDTGNMGAVGTLRVVVMGHIHVAVQIVVAEGSLHIDIQILGSQLGIALRHMQLRQLGCQLFCIQQIQVFQICFVADAFHGSIFHQSIGKGIGIEGLMIGIQTGVDNGDSGAATGIAGIPHMGGTGHIGRNHHVGLVGSVGDRFHGMIAFFHNDLLNAGNIGDGLDLTVAHIGRDQVGGQSQIPDNVQFRAQGALDAGGDRSLILLQLRTVCHCGIVAGNALGREAGLQCGGIPQHNGDADDFIVGYSCLVRVFCLLGAQRIADGTVVHLNKCSILGRGNAGGKNKAHQQRNDQQHGDQACCNMVSHSDSPLCKF